MFAPPPALAIATLVGALEAGWGIRQADLSYLAVGFGSHHWRAIGEDGRSWFLTVDEHDSADSVAELESAFRGATRLAADPGLPFVVAPVLTGEGEVIRVIPAGDQLFTLAVTPWIDSKPLGEGPFDRDDQRSAVLRMLGDLHAATGRIDIAQLPVDDVRIKRRDELEAAMMAVDEVWDTGPFAERASLLLRSDLSRLAAAIARYDELVEVVRADPAPRVVTHGEPHTANVVVDDSGGLHLIDWDTLCLAPRERDLCSVVTASTDLGPYRALVGDVPVSSYAMRLYWMLWDLNEIAEYVGQFRLPHFDAANTQESWANLNEYLPVASAHLDPVLP